jgi:hypothetical protein
MAGMMKLRVVLLMVVFIVLVGFVCPFPIAQRGPNSPEAAVTPDLSMNSFFSELALPLSSAKKTEFFTVILELIL